jgi:2,4-dienoyl-CoA reductase-like NADH-dependent reductase (Old Yellow Enzyme family)
MLYEVMGTTLLGRVERRVCNRDDALFQRQNFRVFAVGLITTPKQANEVLVEGKADIIFLACEFIHDPHFVLRAASELGVAVKPAAQYERTWTSVLTRK